MKLTRCETMQIAQLLHASTLKGSCNINFPTFAFLQQKLRQNRFNTLLNTTDSGSPELMSSFITFLCYVKLCLSFSPNVVLCYG
jgi:hypothetical protein